MKRRDFLALTGTAVAGTTFHSLPGKPANVRSSGQPELTKADADKPNIVWIMTDQQCADQIGSLMDRPLDTTAMDGLVGGGVRFDQAYCTNPICVALMKQLDFGVFHSCLSPVVTGRGAADRNLLFGGVAASGVRVEEERKGLRSMYIGNGQRLTLRRGLTFLGVGAALILATTSTQADTVITTNTGNGGISGQVDYGDGGGFGGNWHIKNFGLPSGFTRKGYVRFDTSSIDFITGDASVVLTLAVYGDANHTVNVYGLDESLDSAALDNSLTWNTAPGNDSSSPYAANTSEAVLLGTIETTTGDGTADGSLVSLRGSGLVDFLNADTNGTVTLLFGNVNSRGENFYIAGDSSGTPPTLNVAPPLTRPFIWVKDSEKPAILDKIANEAWAADVYNALVARAGPHLSSHQTDRRAYLAGLPVEDWSAATPKMKTIPAYPENTVRFSLSDKLNEALDAAVLYYLTGNTDYARLAADVMHNTMQTMLPVTPSSSVINGGWIFQTDYLKEVRVSGPQMPIIYDFLRDYLLTNSVYDYKSDSMVSFSIADAQEVFRTFYALAVNRGWYQENNWSALMSTTMLFSLLALDDEAERDAKLEVYLQTGSSQQTSLDRDYRHYTNPGDIWPESLQYASDVAEIRTLHMVLLERIYPSLNLFGAYPNLPISLPRVTEMRYPRAGSSKHLVLFGDGPRTWAIPYHMYEIVYQHASTRGLAELQANFGAKIKDGMESGIYDRSHLEDYAHLGPRVEPLHLLWSAPDVPELAEAAELPRTDALPYAGLTLQRNTTDDPTYGLMSFVNGAGYIHSHASGMSMELYGLGVVMGAKSGATTYDSTFHKNYSRVYASNNTVIVNGASRGQGGWADIGINTVQNVAMEPQTKQAAVSPNFSFTCSSFEDDKGNLAEASQQRTMGIIRTSPTSGFYVDFFRSDSRLSGEFHDYIYRNIGETTVDIQSGGSPVTMRSEPNRFQNDIGDQYEQPGWRYFTNTEVSPSISDTVKIQFVANMSDASRYMSMHMPGVAAREYAKVDSPPMEKSPRPYNRQNVPTMVIRQYGEAWDKPFVAIYEPHFGANGGTVQSVDALMDGGVLRGIKVVSIVDGEQVTHYVFSNPQNNQTYTDARLGLSFTGRYGIVEHRESGNINLYLGQGSSIEFQGHSLTTNSGNNSAAEAQLVPYFDPVVTANTAVSLSSPALSGYAAWAATHAPNNLPTDDYDNDGIPNAVEYVLGGSKFGSDQDKLPDIIKDGDNMVFTFLRDQASIDGSTTLEIKLGDDPAKLTEVYTVPDAAMSSPTGVSVIKDSSPGFDTIVLRIPSSENTRKFARLKVTP